MLYDYLFASFGYFDSFDFKIATKQKHSFRFQLIWNDVYVQCAYLTWNLIWQSKGAKERTDRGKWNEGAGAP